MEQTSLRDSYYEDRYQRHHPKVEPLAAEKPAGKTRRRWRFKPHTGWPLIIWGLTLLIGIKIAVLPLVEGVYNYVVKIQEVNDLKAQYSNLQKELNMMEKKRDYMKTPAYVEERAHEIGLVKPEESQMVVMEGDPSGAKVKKNLRKKIEYGD